MKINLPSRSLALIAGLLLSFVVAGAQTDIPLKQLKAPRNGISDAEHGVSLTYPSGWDVVRAFRWGDGNRKTTVVLRRSRPTEASVSLFYHEFGPEVTRPPEIREWFRSSFHEKQATKKKELTDYQNDPDSLKFGTTAGGLPRCSYLATFSAGSRRMVEYYVRVAGEKTYAMFLTRGFLSEIEAMRADIDQMADTLKLP
ncbi:MAG: hypothetical protein NTV51_18985 [Verrucomicrobia bacterium]|nr:hypothetical protein [Verrucomicrobiota bacterium]